MSLELERAKVPIRYRRCSFDNWIGTVPKEISDWRGDPWCLFLYGTVGTGKTHLATAFLRWYVGNNGEALWIDVAELLEGMKAEIHTNGNYYFDTAQNMRLLLLDDLGAERLTPWTQERLSLLLRHRYNNQLPTVMTSNVGELSEVDEISARLASRIAEGIVIELSGEDKRISK